MNRNLAIRQSPAAIAYGDGSLAESDLMSQECVNASGWRVKHQAIM